MEVLYLLIPFSVLLVLAVLALFAWALRNGQFDALEDEGSRILDPRLDIAQAGVSTVPEQSSAAQSRH